MSTKTKSALEQLAEKRAALDAAKNQLRQAQMDQSASSRRIAQARGPLTAYYEAVGAGRREADPAEEKRLLTELREAESAVSVTVSMEGMKLVDLKAQSILSGARDAVLTAEGEYQQFVRTHVKELAAEIAVQAKPAAERFDEAWAQVLDAQKEWSRVKNLWRPLVESDRFTWDDFPSRPLAGVADEVYGGVPLPMPRQLAPED